MGEAVRWTKEEKKRTIENFRLEYMFPQYFNEAIMNFFKTRVSHKLSDKNPIKKILSKIENKTTRKQPRPLPWQKALFVF